MSILPPYSFTYSDGKYSFLTDNSVVYNVEFTDGAYYFFDLPADVPVFELNIKVLNAAESIIQPYDKRVEVTIVNILSTFFNDNKNSLIYVCNNLDNLASSIVGSIKTPLFQLKNMILTLRCRMSSFSLLLSSIRKTNVKMNLSNVSLTCTGNKHCSV
jgi:hypothetical protein